MHAMVCLVSTLFHVLGFPHQGKIVNIDQLALFSYDSSTGNIPYVGNTNTPYENIGMGLFKYSSLMGIFPLLPLNVATVNVISSRHDPWIVPNSDQLESFGDVMPLSPAEQMYQSIIMASKATYDTND